MYLHAVKLTCISKRTTVCLITCHVRVTYVACAGCYTYTDYTFSLERCIHVCCRTDVWYIITTHKYVTHVYTDYTRYDTSHVMCCYVACNTFKMTHTFPGKCCILPCESFRTKINIIYKLWYVNVYRVRAHNIF